MGLFTTKKLTDSERQSWSAQFLEIVQGQLEHWGDSPTLGGTWEEHDAEYGRLYIDYVVEYGGSLASVRMAEDGFRSSGWRKVPLDLPGCIILQSETPGAPSSWVKNGVYYGFEDPREPDGTWFYVFVGQSWSNAKSIMRGYVKDWDLENLRKGPAAKKFWNFVFTIVAVAILALLVIFVLLPIATFIATIATELGVIGATTGLGLLGTGAYHGVSQAGDGSFVGGLGEIGDWWLGGVGLSRDEFKEDVPVFQPDGELVLQEDAPENPPDLNQSGIGPLLLAAAALIILI